MPMVVFVRKPFGCESKSRVYGKNIKVNHVSVSQQVIKASE